MAVGIKDIAKIAGVSKATVSLALNNSDLVNADTKELILSIARDLDYIPDSAARSLAKSKSATIGVIVPNIQNEYYGKLVYYLENALQHNGYFALWALSNDNSSLEEQAIREFISKNVEGIILLPINKKTSSSEHLNLASSHNIPMVFASSFYEGAPFECVMADLEQASYELTKHLINSGRQNIYFFSSQLDNVPSKQRLCGIERAHEEQGLVFDKNHIVVFREIDYQSAFTYVQDKGPGIKEADAIITMNDMMALGVVNALKGTEIRIPEDISVAGYDNTTYSCVSPIPITTVDQNLPEISEKAVQVLLSKIKKKSIEACTGKDRKTWVLPQLIFREST